MYFENSDLVQDMIHFHCPRSSELPSMELYMDQVISFINDALNCCYIDEDDKILTPAMINNYVKQGIVSPSKNKKYTTHHLMYLIVVCVFKKMLSIPEICALIRIQIQTYPIEVAYDYFCFELENALKNTFLQKESPMPLVATKETDQTHLLRSTVLAFANKLYIQKFIQYHKQFKSIEQKSAKPH